MIRWSTAKNTTCDACDQRCETVYVRTFGLRRDKVVAVYPKCRVKDERAFVRLVTERLDAVEVT